MKNKNYQKWFKLGNQSWEPMFDDIVYSLPSMEVQYYWTPAGKHPVEIMKLEEEINGRSK